MKKCMALFLVLLMVVALLAGCGNQNVGANTATSTGAVESTSTTALATSTPATTAKPEEVTLNYATWGYSTAKGSTDAWVNDCKSKFNDIINIDSIPTDQYDSMMKTKFSAGDLPDIFCIHGIYAAGSYGTLIAQNDGLADISDLPSLADFSQAAKDFFTLNGKIYGVSLTQSIFGVFYNKKVFSDLGLTIPTDLDEFYAVCDKIKAAGIIPVANGYKDLWPITVLPSIGESQAEMNNGKDIFMKMAKQEVTYSSSPDLLKGFTVMNDLAKKGYYGDKFLGQDFLSAMAMVANGKAAMTINGTFIEKNLTDANPAVEIGFFNFPINAKGEKLAGYGQMAPGVAVSAKSANLKRAKEALNDYLGRDIMKLMYEETPGVPNDLKVGSDDPLIAEAAASITSLAYYATNSDLTMSNVEAPDINSALVNDAQKMLAGGMTPEEVLADFDKIQVEYNNKPK